MTIIIPIIIVNIYSNKSNGYDSDSDSERVAGHLDLRQINIRTILMDNLQSL
jgi:hypothetical protein